MARTPFTEPNAQPDDFRTNPLSILMMFNMRIFYFNPLAEAMLTVSPQLIVRK